MKHLRKTAIALAMASIPAVAAADGMTVYGDFRSTFANISNEDASAAADGLFFVNNASRVGIKGGYSENGWTSFYHLQMGAQNDAGGQALSSRFFFTGLKKKFGDVAAKVTIGRTSTPYKMAGVKLDPFYDTTAGLGNGGATYGLSPLTNGFTNGSVAYNLGFGKISVDAAFYLDEADGDANGEADASHDTNLGVSYSDKGLKAGVQVISFGDNGVVANAAAGESAQRIYGSYKMDAITVGASVETVADASFTYITGSYNLSPATKLAASTGMQSDTTNATDGSGFNVGVFHNIMKKTTVHALVSSTSLDTDTGRSVVGLGIKQQF